MDITKGYKTSEFWVTVITSVLVWLNQSGALGTWQIPVDSLGDIINLAIAYIVGRAVPKTAAAVTATKSQ